MSNIERFKQLGFVNWVLLELGPETDGYTVALVGAAYQIRVTVGPVVGASEIKAIIDFVGTAKVKIDQVRFSISPRCPAWNKSPILHVHEYEIHTCLEGDLRG